jgi:hypothetical protein
VANHGFQRIGEKWRFASRGMPALVDSHALPPVFSVTPRIYYTRKLKKGACFYRERKHVKVDDLMRYAAICRVRKIIRPYLEALL